MARVAPSWGASMGLAPPCTPVMTPTAEHHVMASRAQGETLPVSPQELNAFLGGLAVFTPDCLAKRYTIVASSSRETCASGRKVSAQAPPV